MTPARSAPPNSCVRSAGWNCSPPAWCSTASPSASALPHSRKREGLAGLHRVCARRASSRPATTHCKVDKAGEHLDSRVRTERAGRERRRGRLRSAARSGFVWAPAAGTLGADRTIEFSVVTPREAGQKLLQDFTTQLNNPQQANFIRLSLVGPNPGKIAAILNDVINAVRGRGR